MGEFYVYVHYRNDNNKPFYVGKGKGHRAYVQTGRSEYWQRVASKHGYSVDILFDGLTEREALDEEISVIAELRYHGFELTNHTNGGEGVSGYKATLKLVQRFQPFTKEELSLSKSELTLVMLKKVGK